MNSYLEEIADLCDIHKELTFHIALYNFATSVTLTNGVPIEAFQRCSDIKTSNQPNIMPKFLI